MSRNVCPARTELKQQSYGQEMSAGDRLQWQTVLVTNPHEPVLLDGDSRPYIVELKGVPSRLRFKLCKHCGSVYAEKLKAD